MEIFDIKKTRDFDTKTVNQGQKIDHFEESFSDNSNHHLTPKGVKIIRKLSPIEVDSRGGIKSPLVSEKLGLQLSSKSGKIVSNPPIVSAVKKCKTGSTSVVCGQDQRNEKPSKGPVVQKRSVKAMKNELELKSMMPITSFFEKKKQNLQSKDGKSNFKSN